MMPPLQARALFISYDGLLDPLGGSQILPYIRGIAPACRYYHVLSFEKPARFHANGHAMQAKLAHEGIGWTPLTFTSRWGKAGKLWDLLQMHWAARRIQRKHGISLVHCRSYQAMQTGLMLSRSTGAKTIFDMRGLWVDERLDGGIWKSGSGLDRALYRRYKAIERRLLRGADHIVSLTHRIIPELRGIAPEARAPVSVIPCCADFEHFVPPSPEARAKVRDSLGIAPDATVVCYLGSLGTWYLFDDMLDWFRRLAERDASARLLLITGDWSDAREQRLRDLGLAGLRGRIVVRSATRTEVPELLGTADVMLSFRKAVYSQLACSPTKLAEAYAVGLPSISNANVGDVDEQTRRLDAGAVIDLDDDEAIEASVRGIDAIIAKGGPALRARARAELDLPVAIARYRHIYAALDKEAAP